jgi:sarcosine oxidase
MDPEGEQPLLPSSSDTTARQDTHFDAIVLGLGVMGLSACRALALSGLNVLGLEQFDLGHRHGSSHGSSRLFRKAYFEHPNYVSLAQRAEEGWRELERDMGETLFNACGLLSIGPADSELIRGTLHSASLHNLRCEKLDLPEVSSRFPGIDATAWPGMTTLFEAEAGYIYAERAIDALAESARKHGAAIMDATHVSHWQEEADCVRVLTESGEFTADRLIITAGPWSTTLLTGVGVSMSIVRKLVFWFLPARPELATPDKLPCYATQLQEGFYYGVPDNGDVAEDGVKIARHDTPDDILHTANLTSPEEMSVDGRVDEQYELEAPRVELVARKLLAPCLLSEEQPDLLPGHMGVCQYTLSPDGDFIIDRIPGSSRVVFGAGFSGHGFKFAPAIGEVLAAMARGEKTPVDVGFLGLNRITK